MPLTTKFLPQWTSPPGDTIADVMATRQLSRDDFARLLHESRACGCVLLEGRESITLGIRADSKKSSVAQLRFG